MKHLVPALVAVLIWGAPRASAQGSAAVGFDRLLDMYVRDGLVYYDALRIERAALDRFVASLAGARGDLARGTTDERKAFWLNAYNALVLRTVVDHYPIQGRSSDYPPNSIRQIPGAFDGLTHSVAGESLTLDGIEARMLAEFGDARLVLALGRGARGSGRLRSEAFVAARVEAQLDAAVRECAERAACVGLDGETGVIRVSPLFAWRAEAFERTFVPEAGDRWAQRTPLERAVAAMVYPHLFSREQAVLAADTFQLTYGEFDWSLNEL